MVIKRDGRREPFDRGKIERGIQRALEKRPVSTAEIENIVNEIEDMALLGGKADNEIATLRLGDIVLSKLDDVDKVAYIRFASVYRHFENLSEFITEINNVKKAGNP
jgi:transcriptional repressor NrdR